MPYDDITFAGHGTPYHVWSEPWELSDEDVAILNRLLNAEPGEPGCLNHKPRKVPTADPGLVR